MPKDDHPFPEQRALYQALIDSDDRVEWKGKGGYTALNGNMSSFLDGEGKLSIRLSPDDYAAFEGKYRAKPSIQYGATMRGYLMVPATLLKKTKELQPWFKKSVEYVDSLPAKPTTKKKSAAKKAKKKTTTKKKAVKKPVTRKGAAKKAAAKKVTKKKTAKKTKATKKKATRKAPAARKKSVRKKR